MSARVRLGSRVGVGRSRRLVESLSRRPGGAEEGACRAPRTPNVRLLLLASGVLTLGAVAYAQGGFVDGLYQTGRWHNGPAPGAVRVDVRPVAGLT
jgi:hypothetical protein